MKHRIAILHWFPAEMYPPLLNLVRYFESSGRWDVTLHTTANPHGLPPFQSQGVRIHRGPAAAKLARLWRPVSYFWWQAATFVRLLKLKPDAVLYIEPQSSFPVFLLSFFRRRFPLFIHHHEYHEPRQFLRPGMTLGRWFHALERRRLFSRADWISHTNGERLRLFLADCPEAGADQARLLPNYPPGSWQTVANEAWGREPARPLRMIYVGSLSLRDTFIAEAVEWVNAQPPGSVTLDVYAYNTDAGTRRFLESSESPAVRFHPGGIDYDALPALLKTFHTGLILYRAKTVNYQFNASNKLFEYLAAGLDVVFPVTMEGVKPYRCGDRSPRVIEVDFATSGGLDIQTLSVRGALPAAGRQPAAEDAISSMEDEMLLAVKRRDGNSRQ